MSEPTERLRFLRPEPPAFGIPVEVAPGILWLRLPLPYALDHVNIYLIEDGAGWAVFDTGLCDDGTITHWETVLGATLGGRPIEKVILSHYHPDHAGMAGWLHQRFGAPLYMPQTEYLLSRLLQSAPPPSRVEEPLFYRKLGLDSAAIAHVLNRGKFYLQRVSGLPPVYRRIMDGGSIEIGGRHWQIITGGGHAPEQAMLWCSSDRLFLAADQVLARISPNVSVTEMEPTGDPLAQYLRSLGRLRELADDDTLVLPGHNLAFYGLGTRAGQLHQHHETRCAAVLGACRPRALTCAEIVPFLFSRKMDPHQMSFALGETLAHINYLVGRGDLTILASGAEAPDRYKTA